MSGHPRDLLSWWITTVCILGATWVAALLLMALIVMALRWVT